MNPVDSRARTFAKAVTWQISGLVVMTALTWAITGSLQQGGIIALLGTATGFAAYFIHERIWARIGWGRVTRS